VNGNVVNSCMPGAPLSANDASCNGVDDNCNGAVDEDFTGGGTSCGVGACASTGSQSCVNGSVVSSCTPGTPAANDATCNGIDDNCNGAVDEDYASVGTTCGTGACHATGSTSCVAGMVVNSCTPGAPAANDASCDGVDDNCNGAVDEDFAGMATTCGVGACFAMGSTSCVAGMVVNSCVAGTPAGNDASCNGVDDNCNGAVDEDFVGTATTCGTGACHATGSTSCVNGGVVNSCTPGAPAANDASCNGVDDDCNGAVDDGFVSQQTSCGVGACHSTGTSSCVNGGVVDSCHAGAPAPSDATCDGIDDNCNGTADEGFVGQPTNCGVGACHSTGTTSCFNGGVVDSCHAGTAAPSDATCNGIDDNCNGVADEDYVPTCSGTQSTFCSLGTVQTAQCSDNNVCNGVETCSAGVCHAGTPPVIDDGEPCTTDSCDPQLGVSHVHQAQSTSCSNGNFCDGAETCQPPNANSCVPAPSGVVAWWAGENNTNDIINGLNGTASATGLTYSAARVGQGFKFDGTSGSIDLSSHSAALNLTGPAPGVGGAATLEGWVRVPKDVCQTVFHLRQDDTHEQLLRVGNNCQASNTLVTWVYVNGGALQAAAYVTSNSTLRAALIDANNFHHLAVTFNGGNDMRVYIDGACAAGPTGSGCTGTITSLSGTQPGQWGNFPSPTVAAIGVRQAAGGPTQFFGAPALVNGPTGMIDELTLYDHALTLAQIQSIRNGFGAGKCKPTVCTAGSPPVNGTPCGNAGQFCDGVSQCIGP
jgi:hypothetical protein